MIDWILKVRAEKESLASAHNLVTIVLFPFAVIFSYLGVTRLTVLCLNRNVRLSYWVGSDHVTFQAFLN